jgi:DNA polymerase-2
MAGQERASTYRGLIVHPTHRVRGGRAVIQLHGRLTDGRAFLVEDDRFRSYFFLHARNRDAVRGVEGAELRDTELLSLAGEPLIRVTLPLPGALRPLRDELAARGIATFEADLRFPYRYLMDHALRTSIAIEGRPTERAHGLLHFDRPTLSASDAIAPLSHLSIDLETTADAGRIFSIALAGCGVEEVWLVSDEPVRGARHVLDERTLLTETAARIRALDPDLLIGWNVVDFDLRVFTNRCQALRIPQQQASIGRLPGPVEFPSDMGFTRQSRATVQGRMVLDGIPLVRDAMRLEDYRLETVARAVLDRGKLIEKTGDAAAEITRLYEEDREALVAYNLEDARLVVDILEQEGLLALALERSLLTGMQLDRVGASIASFDLLYLPELRVHGRAAPSVATIERGAPVQGGAVLSPEPGLMRGVAVYDFKSLYPSLIRTFNIDPLALAMGPGEPPGAAIVAPNGAHLSRRDAILPHIIERFMAQRERAKQRGDAHASQAIKIMMNSMFGIFAAPACRFFSPELANAITSFGQQTLAWTSEAFDEAGVEVIYGDTDSVFVQLPECEDAAALSELAETLRSRVESAISARVLHEYGVEAQLELELEKIFDRFFLPTVRGGQGGSKKRYAGWIGDPGRLEIVGLEAVRRDWPAVARRLQEGMLTRLFHDEEMLPFVKTVIADVRSGALDEELVYVKRIRKGSLERYTASSPPHVQAARKLEKRTGRSDRGPIRYLITRDGPEPHLPGEPLPAGIHHAHYVERVLRPIADAILPVVDLSFDQALGEPRQLRLL